VNRSFIVFAGVTSVLALVLGTQISIPRIALVALAISLVSLPYPRLPPPSGNLQTRWHSANGQSNAATRTNHPS
jgi:hypothetical protein